MEENLKVDKDYLEAFNLGYELAKELNLKTPIFKDYNPKNDKVKAIQDGMEKYNDEKEIKEERFIEKSPGSESIKITRNSSPRNDKGEGFDLSF